MHVHGVEGVDSLEDGYGIGNEELEKCAAAQKVEIRKGDFVIVRTGHMERCLARGSWEGYAGGDAPGLRFETAEWIRRTDMAAITMAALRRFSSARFMISLPLRCQSTRGAPRPPRWDLPGSFD